MPSIEIPPTPNAIFARRVVFSIAIFFLAFITGVLAVSAAEKEKAASPKEAGEEKPAGKEKPAGEGKPAGKEKPAGKDEAKEKPAAGMWLQGGRGKPSAEFLAPHQTCEKGGAGNKECWKYSWMGKSYFVSNVEQPLVCMGLNPDDKAMCKPEDVCKESSRDDRMPMWWPKTNMGWIKYATLVQQAAAAGKSKKKPKAFKTFWKGQEAGSEGGAAPAEGGGEGEAKEKGGENAVPKKGASTVETRSTGEDEEDDEDDSFSAEDDARTNLLEVLKLGYCVPKVCDEILFSKTTDQKEKNRRHRICQHTQILSAAASKFNNAEYFCKYVDEATKPSCQIFKFDKPRSRKEERELDWTKPTLEEDWQKLWKAALDMAPVLKQLSEDEDLTRAVVDTERDFVASLEALVEESQRFVDVRQKAIDRAVFIAKRLVPRIDQYLAETLNKMSKDERAAAEELKKARNKTLATDPRADVFRDADDGPFRASLFSVPREGVPEDEKAKWFKKFQAYYPYAVKGYQKIPSGFGDLEKFASDIVNMKADQTAKDERVSMNLLNDDFMKMGLARRAIASGSDKAGLAGVKSNWGEIVKQEGR